MNANIGALNKIHEKIKELNRQNNLLSSKYNNDPKYARIHKRLVERGDISKRESQIFEALAGVKIDADEKVLSNTDMLNNESYFERMMISNVIARFKTEQKIELNTYVTKYINKLVVNEYINEFNGVNFG
jgi:type I restriction enzyme R subunit